MASAIDMSLDDIIQKKKRKNGRIKNQPTNQINNRLPKTNLPITDARNKIISKKRQHITDARDILADKAKHIDARLKLEQMRKKRQSIGQLRGKKTGNIRGKNMYLTQNHGKFIRTVENKERAFLDPSRQVVSQPLSKARLQPKQHMNKRFLENRAIESRSIGNLPSLRPIVRTVRNDIDDIYMVDDDPMGEEQYIPKGNNMLNRKSSLQLKIVAHNNEARERNSFAKRQEMEKDRSPPRPPSILKKRPMVALRTGKEKDTAVKPVEYRIIVSNLSHTVTAVDVKELFGDVGGMVESRLVRPGTAEVIYKTLEDAQRAVDLYHNRQLDGQPMNFLLVTPRATALTTPGSSKPALYSSNSNVEPDLSTFHKVLFSNL